MLLAVLGHAVDYGLVGTAIADPAELIWVLGILVLTLGALLADVSSAELASESVGNL